MKIYFALNEGGTRGDIALHTKIAVLTAAKHTNFRPVLMYTGERNSFTRWLEDHGVEVRDSVLPYLPLIRRLTDEGRYHMHSVGHWLRTNVTIEAKDDEYVLYTDIDVLFRGQPKIDLKPSHFAAAPEFRQDGWNYFNAGVMFVNVPGLRETYSQFEQYLRANIEEKTTSFHDQIAYNEFYRGRWDRLPVTMNWKPYWGANDKADIVHFHGPKLGALNAILTESWHWDNNHGVQIGSLFGGNIDSYRSYVNELLAIDGLPEEDLQYVADVAERMKQAEQVLDGKPIDLSFMNYKMFPES